MSRWRSLVAALGAVALVLALAPFAGAAKPAAKASATPALTAEMLKPLAFRSIGPTRQSGRFVDFAVPPQRPHTFYAATGSGGLWKTENNGQTFEPLFDHQKVFSIGDVTVAPSNPDLLWVGTGEANNSRSTYWGDGAYKSVDGGKTWTNMGLPESHHIGRILVHPANPDVVYVAAIGHLFTDNPERGLYKTEDGGRTWAKSLDVVVDGRPVGCIDAAMDPSNPDVIYAAAYDRIRKPWTYQIGGPGSAIYKTTDAGKTWTKLGGGLPSGCLGRIGVAVAPKNPSVVYAAVENVNKPGMTPEDRYKEICAGKSSRGMIDGEVYRSDDAGATWRKVSPEKRSIGGAPGYYYGQVVVDPADADLVYILSVGVLASRDGGKTWTSPFRFGGDNHALWIDPADSRHMLLGYDHGMGVTWDAGKNWYHPDFLSLAQFYAVDFDMSQPYRVAGGLQDNGSLLGPSTKGAASRRGMFDFEGAAGSPRSGPPIRLEDWVTVGGGDGMYNVFDRVSNRYLYNESQFGPLTRVDLLTGDETDIAYQRQKPQTRWNWSSPILVSAHDPAVIYHCGNVVVRSANRGETWTEVSPDLTTNDPAKLPIDGREGDGNIQHCTITTFDESPVLAPVLWAGTDDGNVWVTRDGGANWTKLNDRIPGQPGCWVSRVAASPSDPARAYVAYTGYRNDDFRPFLYKTTDYGQTWTSIAAGLPASGPVNVVREDPRNPDLLFAGTDFGVFASIDGGASWAPFSGGMPTQPVHDLKIHPRDRDLIVATHGRGLFVADVSALEELTPAVLAGGPRLFGIESKIRWAVSDRHNSGSSNFAGESEPAGIVVGWYLPAKPKAPVRLQVYKGAVLVNELTGGSEAGLGSVVWDMTIRRERTPEEQKAMEERAKRAEEAGYRMRGNTRYEFAAAPIGTYRFVLQVDGAALSGEASVLPDPNLR